MSSLATLRGNLPSTRREALILYRDLLAAAARKGPDHLRKVRRWLCRNDLFYLMVFMFGRKDMNHDWLFARIREVEREPNGFLDLWAREHYKSTIISYGLSAQDILASHGDDPEPRYQGREVTIGIFSFTRPIAKQFLRQIKYEFESNRELQELFPDVLWPGSAGEIQRQAPKWSEDDGITVRRRTNPKEATVEAWGLVDGQPTSKHFWLRVYDDIVTDKSVTTPEMINKTTDAWALSSNLGTEGGWVRYVGTRYHLFDTYRTMQERGIPPRVYPCTSDGSEDFENKAVFASPAYLRKKRQDQGPYIFGAQMLLNPTADTAQGFRQEWLKYWPATRSHNLNIGLVVDPASKKKKSNDYTSAWVYGVDGNDNTMVLEVVRDRLNLVERCKLVFELHRKWRPSAVGYEEYGLQADIEHIEFVQGLENYRFPITPLGGSMAKEDRIKRLIPDFEGGRIFLPQQGCVRITSEGKAVDMVRAFIEEEYTAFPVVSHDDMLDCLSRKKDLKLSPPEPEEEQEAKWMREHLEDSGVGGWETA